MMSLLGECYEPYPENRRTALRSLQAGWPCGRPTRASERDRSEIGWVMLRQAVMPSIFMKFTWHANPHYRYL